MRLVKKMAKLFKRLWAGQLPLEQAFWHYAVCYGLLINLVASLAFLVLIARDGNMALVALAFALPLPYNVVVTVAVWRSANYYPGPKKWADMARVGTVIWMVALTLA